MLVALLRGRVAARAAIGGLAVGVAGLAALALWNTADTAGITSRVRDASAVSSRWTQVLVHVNDEDDALADYVRAGAAAGYPQPLTRQLRSAEPTLTWLRDNRGSTRSTAAAIDAEYATFTLTVTELLQVEAIEQPDQVLERAGQADAIASSLRSETLTELTRIHDQQERYLSTVRRRSQRLRLAEALILIMDALLVGFSAAMLLAYQRRIERQAAASSHQALHDGLTGIANRVLLQDRLNRAMVEGRRVPELVALLLLDLDRFKEVNDTLGHHHGDLLLCEVTRRLQRVLREGDTVARLGGDEFAIVLRRVHTVPDVLVIAERALESLRRPADLEGETVLVGASIGVALAPDHGDDAEKLLRCADVAMYEAKRQSSGVVLYSPESAAAPPARLVAAGELAAAIEAGEVVVHYQPKLHLASGRIFGAEALVRWQHPERGLLGPDQFVPLAEQSELILMLTDRVLDDALTQQRAWVARGWKVGVAVNVGVRSLLVHDLSERIAAAMERHGTDPGDLILEITESAFIADLGRAIDVLGRLRDLGVRISIDDFGTGYSSMTYLQALPADELKIDRGFVSSMEGSRSEAIVRATVQLGHSLGLWVTAEGVEDDATAALLTAMGCDVAQGYHICRPLPGAELIAWLQTTHWGIGRAEAASPVVQPS